MQIIVRNLLVNYEDQGKGRVVILLHGWGTNSGNMADIAGDLSADFRVIAIDFPGFGASERPQEVWGVGEYADLVKAVIEKLNIKKVYALVGHSFGGRVTLKAVSEGIIVPEKIVLIGAAGVKHSASLRNTAYRSVAKVGKVILSTPGLTRLSAPARRKLYKSAGADDYLEAGAMKDIFLRTINEDLSQNAKKVKEPTLLIWGEDDNEAPLKDGEYFHSVMINSTLQTISGSSHFVHNEHPSRVNSWIRKFLA